jgi:hypothetical protein
MLSNDRISIAAVVADSVRSRRACERNDSSPPACEATPVLSRESIVALLAGSSSAANFEVVDVSP